MTYDKLPDLGRLQRQEMFRRGSQVRSFDLVATVTRADDAPEDEPGLNFSGHAAVFNTRTYIGSPPWGFFEEIASEAFDSALERGDDVRFLQNHDRNLLLARTESGTLRLSTDKAGLLSEANMAPVSYARDLSALIVRGDLTQMSFAFWPVKEDESEITITDPESGLEMKALLVTVRDIDPLVDVSAVTYPAYDTTDAGVRMRSARDEGRVARAMLASQSQLDLSVLDDLELEILGRMTDR